MEKLYEGKSKVVYSSEEPGTCIIKYKDTATAGNGVKKEDLPGKGKLNAEISNIIFDYLMKNGVKTHLIKVIDETTVLAKKAEIVMVEVIVRNIAAGSFSKKYGVPEGSPLKNTVVEFSYKSDELGDPMINDSQITAIGLATQEELDELRAMSKRINELMVALFAKGGVRLVDFSSSSAAPTRDLSCVTRYPPTPAAFGIWRQTKSSTRTDSAATSAMFSAATEMCSKDLKALSDKSRSVFLNETHRPQDRP